MNAIITAATGYTEADIQIFLWSVAINCKNTTVFLIVYHQDRKSIEKLREKYPFVRPVYIGASIRKQFARLANYRTRPSFTWLARQLSKRKYSATIDPLRLIGQLAVRIIHERFFIALQILKSHHNVFSNVLLTDCRDVVIQRDPFSHLDGKLVSGLEPKIIRNERYTSTWIEAAYGRDVLNRFSDKLVACAGVTLGSAEKIENYLTELCDEMWRHLPQMIFQDFGYDQAAHIYLIFENHIKLELTTNHQGLIATISLEDSSEITDDFAQGRVKIGDQYPAIIHQYDRHPELLNFFKGLATETTTELSASSKMIQNV
ncbi:MAG: hypothetical protein KME50_12325 [Nostoc desertorum CM1-VF14]|jgi:hypothetical protein|nr:hypothetical protein [Nostoc desertorum CM1-VF14]